MIDRKLIARRLAEGAQPMELSQELGMSPSHLSQVINDETFQLLLSEYKEVISLGESLEDKVAQEKFNKEMDSFWDDVELLSIDALKNNLAVGLVTKTSELLSIAAVANKAVRKAAGSQRGVASVTNNVVQLNISNVLVQRGELVKTTLNSSNQVIEVDGRTIINAPKTAIFDRLKSLQEKKHEHAKLQNPSAITLDEI